MQFGAFPFHSYNLYSYDSLVLVKLFQLILPHLYDQKTMSFTGNQIQTICFVFLFLLN